MRHPLFVVGAVLIFFSAQAQTGALQSARQQHEMDSVRKSYQTARTDTDKANILVSLADDYYDLFDFKNAGLYNEYSLALSEKLKRSADENTVMAGRRSEAEYYLTKGNISHKQGNYRQALDNYFRALNLYTALGNEHKIAVLFSDISTTYSALGNYSESFIYSFKALNKHESLHDEKSKAIELNNIGAIYSDIRELAKALAYNSKAMELSFTQGDKRLTALYTGNVGHSYQVLGDSAFTAGNLKLSTELQDKALDYYFKALRMSEEISDDDNTAVCLENIGIMYFNNDAYKKALPYLLKALGYYRKLGLIAEQSYCLNTIGSVYYGLGQAKTAEDHFKQALALAEQTHSNYYLMEVNEGISTFYGKTNRPAKALEYYKKYIANRDSIFNRETSNNIARTELNYEFEKKQAEIKFKNDAVIYKLEADNTLNKQLRLFLILIIVLALVLLVFARRAYANKKRFAEFMTAERDRKEILLQEVHHRINNNLQIISSLLSLQANSADDERLYEYLKQSQNRIQSLAVLHDLLYQADSPLRVNMRDYLDKVMDYHREILSTLPAKVDVEMNIATVDFHTQTAVPIALIVNELVTNAIKYAFKDSVEGKIRISLQKLEKENKWKLCISDTGKGIPENVPARKESLGLRLIGIMSRQINATFTKSNSPGATFEIIFKAES